MRVCLCQRLPRTAPDAKEMPSRMNASNVVPFTSATCTSTVPLAAISAPLVEKVTTGGAEDSKKSCIGMLG